MLGRCTIPRAQMLCSRGALINLLLMMILRRSRSSLGLVILRRPEPACLQHPPCCWYRRHHNRIVLRSRAVLLATSWKERPPSSIPIILDLSKRSVCRVTFYNCAVSRCALVLICNKELCSLTAPPLKILMSRFISKI